jgi:uncharacterized FlaG/YvyC family protein
MGNSTSNPIVELADPARPRSVDRSDKTNSGRRRKIENVRKFLQENLGVFDVKIDYSVDKPTGILVARVINNQNGRVVREIPSKQLLALAEAIRGRLQGLFFDERI